MDVPTEMTKTLKEPVSYKWATVFILHVLLHYLTLRKVNCHVVSCRVEMSSWQRTRGSPQQMVNEESNHR